MSFLYPSSYYEDIRRRILAKVIREQEALEALGFASHAAHRFTSRVPRLGFIHFAPGFLSGEDLYSKIVRGLEGAFLEGRPYTDVIIDGLHNLALQFPGARDTDVLWPIVYSTLSRMDVTTITTFTSLALKQIGLSGPETGPEEALFRLRTHLPLMHALVQASDFVLELEKAPSGEYCRAICQAAVNQDSPRELPAWHRGRLEFVSGVRLQASVPTST